MTAVLMIAAIGGILAFAYLKFPENAVVIFLAVAVSAGIFYFLQRQEKAARFDAYYSAVREFGTPLSFNNQEAAFERHGTRFDVGFPYGENNAVFKVNFYVPHVEEKFSVQNRTLLVTRYDDCQEITNSPLPPEYLVQSRSPEFLLNLLRNREVLDEVLNYRASFWGRISISFADGSFEMVWAPPVSEQIDGFAQICRSAVVFHDELKKIPEKI